MNRADLRTLRGQLWLTGGLFLGCVVLAGLIVSQRGRFESLMEEKYTVRREGLSPAGQKALEAVEAGKAPSDEFRLLQLPERRALYEFWIKEPEPTTRMLRALIASDAEFYLTCAEQSVVCGNASQRQKGLDFLARSAAAGAKPRFERLARWAEKRRRPDWQRQIEEAKQRSISRQVGQSVVARQ